MENVQNSTAERPPIHLPANGRRVLEARYLRRNADGHIEETVEHLVDRVAKTMAAVERAYGKSEQEVASLCDRYYHMMGEGIFIPNSPTLMNAGLGSGMLSACVVIPVEDSIEGIFGAVEKVAVVQKAGMGDGIDFSPLRPRGDRVSSSGGTTSGPVSFMRVFSEATNAIQQGALRRGANMGILRVDHPDIVEFIEVKADPSALTNFNLSVAFPDAFLMAVLNTPDAEHVVINPRTHESYRLPKGSGFWRVGELFDLIVEHAWKTGEPGIIFIDRMNEDNPTPHVGQFAATNACGEQPLLPYESCNLGSINLTKFVRNEGGRPQLDMDRLKETVKIATRFLDAVIDANRFPFAALDLAAKANRKIGLGVMGFADSLCTLRVPYDSEEALRIGSTIMRTVSEASHEASIALADEKGVFPNWEGSTWAKRGIRIRNACTTCVAPTGSISVIAGCSGGIEPIFGLVYSRRVLGGEELPEVNPVFEQVARDGGFFSDTLLREIERAGSIQQMEKIPADVRHVFVTAHDISPEGHVRMQAAFQEHCDASISKTINLKANATPADVRNAFLLAHSLRCKGVTVYRDGCRQAQPMAIKARATAESGSATPISLPDMMPAIRLRQVTPFGNMHVKVVMDPADRMEREVFAQLGKGGDLANSDLEAICRLVSLFLRVGGRLEDVHSQLDGIGSSLTLPTKDGAITSLSDGLAKAIRKYLDARNELGLEAMLLGRSGPKTCAPGGRAGKPRAASPQRLEQYKVRCPMDGCSGILAFQEGCVVCRSCGFSAC